MKTTSHSTSFCLYSRAAVLGCAIGIAVGVALNDFAVGAAIALGLTLAFRAAERRSKS